MAHHPTIDEELLSGFLDGQLSHREMQRVRLHLEQDSESRRLLREMRAVREGALATRFREPSETTWPELPRTRSSRLTRSLGWLLLIAWLTVFTAIELWRFLSQAGDPFEIFLVLGLPGAFVLLFASVLIDRLQTLTDDRYRDVSR